MISRQTLSSLEFIMFMNYDCCVMRGILSRDTCHVSFAWVMMSYCIIEQFNDVFRSELRTKKNVFSDEF